MKKHIVTIFLLLMCILIAQDAKTYLAQADLEDKIQSKVTTALSKMFDDDKFFVWARVELKKKQGITYFVSFQRIRKLCVWRQATTTSGLPSPFRSAALMSSTAVSLPLN